VDNDARQAADVSVSPGRGNNSGSRPARRDRYADVGAAARASLDAVKEADPPLTPPQLRAYANLFIETATFSKMECEIGLRRLAERSKLSVGGLRRILQRLIEIGAIVQLSNGHRSRFGLPRPDQYRAQPTGDERARAGHTEPRADEDGEARARGSSPTPPGARIPGGISARGRAHATADPRARRGVLRGEEPLNPLPAARARAGTEMSGSSTNHGPKPRDELFEALVDVVGWNTSELTKAARGKINAALKELRAVGATPAEIRARAQRYRRMHSGATLTPNALAAWWAALSQSAAPVAVEGASSRYRPASEVLGEVYGP
jgi:hypothetical protein